MHPSNPPKGSLEDLFRHHLLESEAAAVPPRPQVWEQIDNSLLLAQNEKYRRRLVAYRWAMAASLLLASLAGGGWWHSQQQVPTAGSLARATGQLSRQQALPAARHSTAGSLPAPIDEQLAARATRASAVATATSPTPHSSAIDQTSTTLASASSTSVTTSAKTSSADRALGTGLARWAAAAGQFTSQTQGRAAKRQQRARYALLSNTPMISGSQQPALPAQSTFATAASATPDAALTSPALATIIPATPTDDQALAGDAPLSPATLLSSNTLAAEATLATRQASLMQPTASLPTSLAEVAVAPGPPLELMRHWQYGASYSASAYNPNIEWAKSPILPTASSLPNYPASFSRSVAAEYRDNLRPGLGQRLSLWAARRLGNGRWSLHTGVELIQNTATSASSVAFVGEPVADLTYLTANASRSLQRTSYRYRSVSVPAELHYANPLRSGFSLYGRIGALVTALLNVRSEVAGIPEATHTYSVGSTSTPYRRVSAGLRGGAGVQYRPAGHQWSLNLGPVVEMGVFSLDVNPTQNFWNQQRPYSFGLEAGMEIGRGFRLQ